MSLWFVLGSYMFNKNRNVSDEHIYYVINDIQKPFKVGIL